MPHPLTVTNTHNVIDQQIDADIHVEMVTNTTSTENDTETVLPTNIDADIHVGM